MLPVSLNDMIVTVNLVGLAEYITYTKFMLIGHEKLHDWSTFVLQFTIKIILAVRFFEGQI